MLEKTNGAMKNGQSRETGNIGYIRHRTKPSKAQKHYTICVVRHYTKANTNNINKT